MFSAQFIDKGEDEERFRVRDIALMSEKRELKILSLPVSHYEEIRFQWLYERKQQFV